MAAVTTLLGGTMHDDHELAEYIASMCEQLACLASQSGWQTGAYLLRMASLEFSNQHKQSEPSARSEALSG